MLTSFNIEKFIPQSSLHLVELCPPADRTSGGVFLPEILQINWCEAIIKRSGPGWLIPDTDRHALSWLHSGWRIVMQQHHYQPLYRGAKIGLIRDEDILGTIIDDYLKPLSDWVKVSIEDRVTGGDILLPEESQRRPRKGKVIDWGPGRVITEGPLSGCRLTIPTRLQLSPLEFDRAVVTWGANAEIVELGREGVECAFICADDLECVEIYDE